MDFFGGFGFGKLYFAYLRGMKLRIGFDAKRLFRNYTGLGNYSRTLVGNLSARFGGNDYLLFAAKTSENAEAVDFLSERYEVVRPHGLIKALWRLRAMSSDIKAQNIDIFHGLSHDLPFGIQKSGAKSVVTIHDVCYKTFPKMFPFTERLIYELKYRHSLKSADKIIAISKSTKDDILRFFGAELSAKIEVVYQALNPLFYERVSVESARKITKQYGAPAKYMLYVGSVNSRKNLLNVIHSYALLDRADRIPLVVIGSGSGRYFKSCFETAARLDLDEYIIHLKGITSMSVLRAFYTSASGLIYPSFYEGFGLPVTEAILCGTPVITSSISSLPEAGGEFAFYVDPNDTTGIAGAILEVLKLSGDEREGLTNAARAWALEKFNPDVLTAQVEQIYEKLKV